MKINANDIKIGHVLDHEGRLCIVTKTVHTKPGKGGAYMQIEMKDMRTGTKLNTRFASSESVERAQLEEREYNYLYHDDIFVHAMDMTNYEEVELSVDIFEKLQIQFLREDVVLKVVFHESAAIAVKLPDTMVWKIAECESYVKNQTVTSSFKAAILENGVKIMVPQFIAQGDAIVVNIGECEYVERAKN